MASLQKYMIHPHKVPFFAKKMPKNRKNYMSDAKSAFIFPSHNIIKVCLLVCLSGEAPFFVWYNIKRKSPETLVFTGLLTGADDQNRTGDLILTKDALYRLSYISNRWDYIKWITRIQPLFQKINLLYKYFSIS